MSIVRHSVKKTGWGILPLFHFEMKLKNVHKLQFIIQCYSSCSSDNLEAKVRQLLICFHNESRTMSRLGKICPHFQRVDQDNYRITFNYEIEEKDQLSSMSMVALELDLKTITIKTFQISILD